MVYLRNGTGCPLVGYADLALRWGQSKTTVGRVLKKLEQQGYLTLLTFPGRHGSVISLNNYLSTMFQISDMMIDKEEIAMSLNIKIAIPEDDYPEEQETAPDKKLYVSNSEFSVSKSHMKIIIQKAAKMLAALGVACCECPKSQYKLSPLSPACKEEIYPRSGMQCGTVSQEERFTFEIACEWAKKKYLFELALVETENKSLGEIVK